MLRFLLLYLQIMLTRNVILNAKCTNVTLLHYSEHWLHRMLVPMSMTRVTIEMYEEQSFLRKRGLLTFLRQILEPLDEFDIVLEHSLTQGI